VAEDAIAVSPAYRLAPEAKISEILEDIRDFWIWLHQELPCVLGKRWPNLTPDLNQILAVGESAGGYAALQSAFLFNTYAKIKAVIAQYPACYPDIPSFNPPPAEVDPTLYAVVDDYINNIKAGAVRTQTPYPELGTFGFTALAAGRVRELWGSPEDLKVASLEYALSKAKDVPPIWVIQGSEDAFVRLVLFTVSIHGHGVRN
jgi:acetyl esterase/lipase